VTRQGRGRSGCHASWVIQRGAAAAAELGTTPRRRRRPWHTEAVRRSPGRGWRSDELAQHNRP
jgi:hypothetical protein